MTYNGHIKNGVVVLDEAPDLPEGAKVIVNVLGDGEAESIHPEVDRLTGILPGDLDAEDAHRQRLMDKHK